MKNRPALLVIDMQKGSFTPKTPRFDTSDVISRINDIAALFRKLNFPVIFAQHDGNGFGVFEKNTYKWELLDELIVELKDLKIDKYANDVFYNSNLQLILNRFDINELYIMGCATDFCVQSTIQSALSKNYNITVVEDGHTTGERPKLNAKQVIDHYNWVWRNMIPTKGQILVKNHGNILRDSY